MIGQLTEIKSLREMFEMISLEMQNHFYFNPRNAEVARVGAHKNLVFRERLKKPSRMRHYGQWEHKRTLDEKKRHVYLEENEQMPSESVEFSLTLSKANYDQIGDLSLEDSLALNSAMRKGDEETSNHKRVLSMCEKFVEEMGKHFALAEKNKERRHKEKMAVRQKELELTK